MAAGTPSHARWSARFRPISGHPGGRGAVALAAAALVLALPACGDDAGDGSAAEPAAAIEDDGSRDCAGTDLAFVNDDAGRSGTATTALARSNRDGAVYEAHVADFDLGEDDLRSWRPEVPDGGNVITIQLTVFNASEDLEPVAPGTEIELTTEFDDLTFLVRHFTTDGDWNEARNIGVDSVGTLKVTEVGDTFCFEVDYRDQDKQVTGTVEATVFERS